MAQKLQKSKRFCAIKGDNVISSIGAPLQTLGAPNTPYGLSTVSKRRAEVCLHIRIGFRHLCGHTVRDGTHCFCTSELDHVLFIDKFL